MPRLGGVQGESGQGVRRGVVEIAALWPRGVTGQPQDRTSPRRRTATAARTASLAKRRASVTPTHTSASSTSAARASGSSARSATDLVIGEHRAKRGAEVTLGGRPRSVRAVAVLSDRCGVQQQHGTGRIETDLQRDLFGQRRSALEPSIEDRLGRLDSKVQPVKARCQTAKVEGDEHQGYDEKEKGSTPEPCHWHASPRSTDGCGAGAKRSRPANMPGP